MPTAVERWFSQFLKLDIDHAHEQRELNAAFQNIDADFIKLGNSDLTRTEFLKLEHKVSQDIHKIGEAYVETGNDFVQIANFAARLDEFVVKLSPATVPTNAAAIEGSNLHADFLKLDGALRTSGLDFKFFGAHFLKLEQSGSAAEFTVKLHDLGKEASGRDDDLVATQSDFQTLASDFLRLGGDSTSSLDHKLGAALQTVADDFGALVGDFAHIGSVLNPSANGGSQEFAAAQTLLGPVGGAFSAANSDFLKLSHDLTAVAGPAAAGIDILIHNAFGGGGGTAFP